MSPASEYLADTEEETVEAVVARIQASGHDVVLPCPTSEDVQRFLQQAPPEPLMSREKQLAWEQMWSNIVEEMRRRDRADEQAEGRVPLK